MKRSALTLSAAIPLALLLTGCGDDLESRNAAAGMDSGADDVVITRQEPDTASDDGRLAIDGLGNVDEVSDDFAVIDAPVAIAEIDADTDDDEAEPRIVDASPDDLRDTAQGFAPEPMDDASGIDPSPILPEPVSD